MNKVETYRFHFLHKKEVKGILWQIEKEKGRMDKKITKLADAYACEVLGSKVYAPWLYVYSAVQGTFKEGWIPDNYYREIVVPKTQGSYGKLSFNNMLTNSFFKMEQFPDVAYFINGQWISTDLQLVSFSHLKRTLFKNHQEIVFKLDHSFQGTGIYLFNNSTFKEKVIRDLGDGAFQYRVRQHEFFDDFGFSALPTFRLTTVIDPQGSPSLRSAYLKLGRQGETHIHAKASVSVPIDITSGKLWDEGHLTNGSTTLHHPDTKMNFKDKIIPNFDKSVQFCKNLHLRAPYIMIIGWDVVVDHLGEVQVLEWNGYHNDIKYSEATQGPCFADLGWEQLWKGN